MKDEELLAGLRRAAKEAREEEQTPSAVDDAMTDRLAARLISTLPTAPQSSATRTKPKAVSPRPRRVLALVVPIAAALAIAASAVLVLRGSGAQELPAYGVETTGEHDVRGAGDRGVRPHVARGGRLSILARPTTEVTGAVSARAWVVASGATRPFAGTIDIADRGAARLVTSASDTASLSPGEATLVIVVGRPGSVPAEPPSADGAGFRRLAVVVDITP